MEAHMALPKGGGLILLICSVAGMKSSQKANTALPQRGLS